MILPRIVLASKSPRRRQLLELANIPFDILSIDVDESFEPGMRATEVAEHLAVRKAQEAVRLRPGEIILTADSVVIQDGVIYEKPADREDARRIIRVLSNNMHIVTTGVCLTDGEKMISFTDTSVVYMDEMTEEEIDWYVDTCSPYDKAGSYGIQDWIGHCKVKRIEGSYDTIMGLPTHRVYATLRNWNS